MNNLSFFKGGEVQAGGRKEVRKRTWHYHLVAALATVPILSGSALAAHDLAIIPSVEGL